MIRGTSKFLLVSLLLVCFLAMTAFGAQSQDKTNKKRLLVGDRTAERALAYALDREPMSGMAGSDYVAPGSRIPIGMTTVAGGSESPGVVIGNTWYDYQHNCSIGRMIGTGPHTGETGYTVVHFDWTYLPEKNADGVYRTYAYAAYRSQDHSQLSPIYLLTEGEDYGGFVNIDVTPDNRAIVGGHNNELTNPDEGYLPQFHYDGGPAYGTFPNMERIPDSVALFGIEGTLNVCWPHFFFQFGTDTVMHVVAEESPADGYPPQSMTYFRKIGFEGSENSEWEYPPYVVDTVSDIAHDIVGQRNGDRVCMTWFANLPYQEPSCDTCSGLPTVYEGLLLAQKDNDIYYQQSYTQGATWEPRVNITQIPIGAKAYKAYCDASSLYDSGGNLHIVWNAIPWAADTCIESGGFCWAEPWNQFVNVRLMHWSENVPYVRPIADQVQDVNSIEDSCFANDWSVRIAKPSLAECDGNLYAIWHQFNNPHLDIIDDCAEWGYEEYGENSANAEIYVSVSEDWGMTWDYQRNLTNTYTPRCDPKFADDCQHDYWASINYMGREVDPSEDWTGAVIVDPSGGGYIGNHYLDIQYMVDRDAGAAVRDWGSWTDNPMKWFRLPCVDPIPNSIFHLSWYTFGDPSYCKPGESLDTTILVENLGNTELTYTVDLVYDSGGASDWISIAGFSGALPSGLAGMESATITVNSNLMTTYGNYFGRVHFEGNDPNNLPCDVSIELIVADTIIIPTWDSIKTACVGLIVGNNGNCGRGGLGRLNMDFYPEDCDTMATVYLYESSPLIGWIDGDDTVITESMWSTSFTGSGFRPVGGDWPAKYCPAIDANAYHTGTMTTQDSTVAVSKVWIAPESGDCNFVISYTKVWSFDGNGRSGLVIGEGTDWDVPSDYLIEDTALLNSAVNSGGIDPARNLVYCQGYEAYGLGSDTTYPDNCQYNDDRYGGNAMIESYLNGSPRTAYAWGGFVEMNDSVSGTGYLDGPLYQRMEPSGFTTTDSLTDLNTVVTYEFNFDLGGTDVYEVVSITASVMDGELTDLQATIDAAKAWYLANGGYDMFEDADVNGQIDVCSGCCKNEDFGEFYSHDGEFNILDIDNFIEWLLRNNDPPPPIYDCLEQIDVTSATTPGVPDGSPDILDIDYMISHLLRQTIPDLGECP